VFSRRFDGEKQRLARFTVMRMLSSYLMHIDFALRSGTISLFSACRLGDAR
jgi:hypothetical protein